MGEPYRSSAILTTSIARTTPAQKPRGRKRITFLPVVPVGCIWIVPLYQPGSRAPAAAAALPARPGSLYTKRKQPPAAPAALRPAFRQSLPQEPMQPPHSPVQEVVEAEGHLIDSHIMEQIFDTVIEFNGHFNVEHFFIGRTNAEPSRLRLRVEADSAGAMEGLLSRLLELGCSPADGADAQWRTIE